MHKQKRILIVDDDIDLCKILKQTLTQKGYIVKTINYGYLAFIELKNIDYDLVFMDLRLTGINGVNTYKEVKEIKPNIKVIIITGYGMEEVGDLIKEGKEHGMIDEYLRKPFDAGKMIEVIEKYT